MNFLDLPLEIVLQVLQHTFPPWSATMSITCELSPIPNTRILRTCHTFYKHGVLALQSSFTGEFIRHDRRGCIINTNLEPCKWYSWIMSHTRILHLHDAYFTIWYIPRYWEFYPALEGFIVSVVPERAYNDPSVEMPDFAARVQRCGARTTRFARAYYAFHGYLFDEAFVRVWKDMHAHERGDGKWPAIEYRYCDCQCHPGRQTVSLLFFLLT